jgi:putative membrane protein
MGAGGWIAMVLFWIALITLVVWLVVKTLPGGGDRGRGARPEDMGTGTERPEQILDRRYAAGELDQETYQMMRATLASGRSSGQGGAE